MEEKQNSEPVEEVDDENEPDQIERPGQVKDILQQMRDELAKAKPFDPKNTIPEGQTSNPVPLNKHGEIEEV